MAYLVGMTRAKLHFKEEVFFNGWTPCIFPKLVRQFVFRFWYQTGYIQYGDRTYMNWHLLDKGMECAVDVWSDFNAWLWKHRGYSLD